MISQRQFPHHEEHRFVHEYPFRGLDKLENHCDAVVLLRLVKFGDSSRSINVAPKSPISNVQTHRRHYS